jgi:hypothetical protein
MKPANMKPMGPVIAAVLAFASASITAS